MGSILNPLKESRAMNATVMDISRKSVLIIWEGRAKCMPLLLVTSTPLIQIQMKAVMNRETSSHS